MISPQNRLIRSRLIALGGGFGRVEGWRKKEKGLMDTDHSVVLVGWVGVGGGGRGYRGNKW